MAKNAVIRTDLMHGTKNPDMLVSLRFYANDAVAEVENGVIVELKAVSTLVPIHEMQLINYLRATGLRHGMLINFGSEKFQCIKRVV